jgi:hypothetical protein
MPDQVYDLNKPELTWTWQVVGCCELSRSINDRCGCLQQEVHLVPPVVSGAAAAARGALASGGLSVTTSAVASAGMSDPADMDWWDALPMIVPDHIVSTAATAPASAPACLGAEALPS